MVGCYPYFYYYIVIKTKRFLNAVRLLVMMITSKTEKQLKNLGLNSYEVKLWVALLSRGVLTAGEISDIANVPRSRSYDVLESLEKKGFVVAKAGKPIKYSATPPLEVVARVKQKIRSDANEKIKDLISLKNKSVINDLVLLHEQGSDLIESTEMSGSLQGKSNIYNHLEVMLGTATKSVLISSGQNEFVEMSSRFKTIFGKLKSKHVKVKILTQINESTEKYVNELKNITEIKHSDNKARFCIVDGKEMVFMVLDDTQIHPSYDVAIWVVSPLAKDFERKYF